MRCAIFLPMKKIALLAALALFACSPKVETRGAIKDVDWQERVKPGATQAEVAEALGTPSARSTFGEETWYYISTRREAYAFMKPSIEGQDVTKITFEPDGTVKTVENYDKSAGQDIEISSKITPTEGHQMTFMEQVLGNLGRFNSPGGAMGSGPGGRRSSGGTMPGGR